MLSKKKIPTDITFGVELELFIPNPNGRWSLESIAKHYTNEGIRAKAAGYHGQDYDIWQIKADRSIQPGERSENAMGFELVGPILKGKRGLELLKSVLEITKEMGVLVNKSCGFHVHIGLCESLDGLKGIILNFIKYELAFDSMVPPSRRNNQYCMSNNCSSQLNNLPPHDKFAKIKNCRSTNELRRVIQDSRFYKLNLPEDKPTIEFRQHSATYEWTKACRWVKILVIFIEQSQNKPPNLNFHSDRDEQYRFDSLFDSVICDSTLKDWAEKRRIKFKTN